MSKHKLWTIWKDNISGITWAVQCPKGIMHFRTKKEAKEVAQELEKTFDMVKAVIDSSGKIHTYIKEEK